MTSTPPKSEPRPPGETTKKLPRLHSDGDDDEVFVELRGRKRKEREMTAEVEAKDELIKSQAATIRQLQSDNDAKERELKDLRGRLFACPTTEQIKAQTKNHCLACPILPGHLSRTPSLCSAA